MEDIIKRLKKMKEEQLKNFSKDKKKGIPVRINPDSYYAKEIEYQTILLKDIKAEIDDIKRLLNKSNP